MFCQDANSTWVSVKHQPVLVNTTEKDLGFVMQNEKTVFKFKLKNVGNRSLKIWHVSTSCGCTTPKWTGKPIKNGKQGVVKIKFDSSEIGEFNKSVFVYTNFADKPIELTITGTVINSKSDQKITKRNTNFNSNIPINH